MAKQAAVKGKAGALTIPADSGLGQGIVAAARLLEQDFWAWQGEGIWAGHRASAEIGNAPDGRKAARFYGAIVPLRRAAVAVLAAAFRRYLKLALAHASLLPGEPAALAQAWLQPAVDAALAELRQWTMLACDGQNECVRPIGTMTAQPGETTSLSIPTSFPAPPPPDAWRAPAWLFSFALPAVTGIGPLKTAHVPAAGPADARLGPAHTRLALRGLRRIFLAELAGALERVRDEELAARAAIPPPQAPPPPRRPNKREGWEQKEKLMALISEILNRDPGIEGEAFCAELDKHHAPPLSAWQESGEWDGLTFKAAWKRPSLRKKIRRVRQEALRTVRAEI